MKAVVVVFGCRQFDGEGGIRICLCRASGQSWGLYGGSGVAVGFGYRPLRCRGRLRRFLNPRGHEIQSYFPGHIHIEGGDTIDGPQHSGGTDKYGCHNASVPYHCH